MSKTSLTLDRLRIKPRSKAFLDSNQGAVGEIFYDGDSASLRLYDGTTSGGVSVARADLSNVSSEGLVEKTVDAGIATAIFNVTIQGPQAGDSGNKYVLNSVYRAQPTLIIGYTYVFIQDDLTNVYFPNANNTTPNPHPLNFSADNLSGELGGGTSYLDGVRYFLNGELVDQATYTSSAFVTATSRQVWITVTSNTPAELFYWCYNHVAMGNSISVAEPGSGSGGIADIEAGDGIAISVDNETTIISNTGALDIVAGTGISITESQGVYTINSTVSVEGITGDLTFTDNTVDLDTGSEIVFTPQVSFQSDVVLATELVFADGSTQSTATLEGVGISNAELDDDNLVLTLTDDTIINVGSVVGPEGPAGPSGEGSGDVSTVGAPVTTRSIVRYSGTSGNNIQESLASISDTGTVTAPAFSGGGSALTNLNASNLASGTVPDARFPATLPTASGANLTTLNASNLASGTVPDARFPATLPTASGANLTTLNASNLASGTVPVDRLGASGTRDATTFLRGDNTWATVTGGDASNSFETITVAGQDNVVADSPTDTLTLVAGTGIAITTNASADTVTITNSSPNISQNAFTTVAVSGQSNVEADTATDTLTLAAGTGITITTNASTDTITITSTASGGASAFTELSDVSSASLTVDQIYLPAITSLLVTNTGATAYLFDQYSGNNPTIYAISGTTIAFKINASGHPFLIQDGAGNNFNTGLVHVTTNGTVTTGSSAQGKDSGTLYWKVPFGISGGYRYQCLFHSGMVGSIQVKDFQSI
jgi:plastocyanin